MKDSTMQDSRETAVGNTTGSSGRENIRDTIVESRRVRLQTKGHAQGLPLPETRTAPLVPFSPPPLLICEIKRRSPSRGNIDPGLDPVQRAHEYYLGGVRTFSILTEEEFFGGSLSDLVAVKTAHPEATILRKDFLLDSEDVDVSFRLGADAILLIASVLEKERLDALYRQATDLGLSVLVEVHTKEDVEKVRSLRPEWVGINARNLETFRTDLLHPLRVRGWIDWSAKVVFESGVQSPSDGWFVGSAGFEGLLVGESVVRNPSSVPKLRLSYEEGYEMACSIRGKRKQGDALLEEPTQEKGSNLPAPDSLNGSTRQDFGQSKLEGPFLEPRKDTGQNSSVGFDPSDRKGSNRQAQFWTRVAEALGKAGASVLAGSPQKAEPQQPEPNKDAMQEMPPKRERIQPPQENLRIEQHVRRPLVKVCGITNSTDAYLAVEAGADLLGFIFAPSPRQVHPTFIRELRGLPVLKVGVVVAREVGETANRARLAELFDLIQGGYLDALQVHGTEGDGSFLQGLRSRGIPYYTVWNPKSPQDLKTVLEKAQSPRFLVDASKEGMYGGTGVRVPDEVLQEFLERAVPLWLAGGLRPESIREVVKKWNPELVDVSSGLEAFPGKKDPEKIRKFFKEIQDACAAVGG